MEGREEADRIVMTSGLSSAFSSSEISGLSTVMLHRPSYTPDEQVTRQSVSDLSPNIRYKGTENHVNIYYNNIYRYAM